MKTYFGDGELKHHKFRGVCALVLVLGTLGWTAYGAEGTPAGAPAPPPAQSGGRRRPPLPGRYQTLS